MFALFIPRINGVYRVFIITVQHQVIHLIQTFPLVRPQPNSLFRQAQPQLQPHRAVLLMGDRDENDNKLELSWAKLNLA